MGGAPRDRRAALGAVLAVAAGVRLAGIGDTLSHDEGYSWIVAAAPSADAFLDRLAAYENTPPLFYALLAALPHGDEAWLRLPAAAASVGQVAVLYALVRTLLGTRAGLLAALALAVAPYHVSFANYSRAFMLAGLGLLLALWAAAQLARGGRRRWWGLWAAGGSVALLSEYDAALALAAIAAVLLALGSPPRRETMLLAPLPLLALAAWLPELLDSLAQLDETKVAPVYPGPSPAALRDVVTALALGEHGAARSAGVRWLELAAIAGALAAATAALARRDARACALLAGTATGTLALAGAVALAGPDVFAQRYLTFLIPLGAALAAGGLDAAARAPGARPLVRALPALAAAVLVAAGAAVAATRHGRELEPDPRAVERAAHAAGEPALVRTNSAVAAYYLRRLPVALDRPFGLDAAPDLLLGGRRACPPRCRPVVAVDDARVAGGARPGGGPARGAGPFAIRALPGESAPRARAAPPARPSRPRATGRQAAPAPRPSP